MTLLNYTELLGPYEAESVWVGHITTNANKINFMLRIQMLNDKKRFEKCTNGTGKKNAKTFDVILQ